MPPTKRAFNEQYQTNALRGILAVAVVASVAVLATIDDPGVTCDEYYDAAAGRRLVTAWQAQGWAFFRAESIEQNYGSLTRHPPLGRWLLGWMQQPFDATPHDPHAVSLIGARFAPALALGWLVWFVGWSMLRAAGTTAAIVGALAVVLVPRVFAHAHFATLDTFASVTYVSAVLALVVAYESGAKGWYFGLAGLVWGLALATKIHGLLLLPPVVMWMLWQFRWRAFVGLAWWSVAGGLVFYALWPWLWLAPYEHLLEFVASATERQSLHVFYGGQVWNDRLVPWHYPWIMLVVTLPLGLFLLGMLGFITSGSQLWRDGRRLLLLLTWGSVLLVFSWPGTPVYDGTRLFLMVFPLWAMWVGYGGQWLYDRLEEHGWKGWWPRIVLGGLLSGPLLGTVLYHPFQSSYYSPLVGGLAGAARLGFEPTYWGDSIDAELMAALALVPEGEAVLFGPNLAPYQAPAVEAFWPEFLGRNIRLFGWDSARWAEVADCRYALVYHRRADLESLDFVVEAGSVLAENQRQGVWLGRLYELPRPVGKLIDPP